MRRLDLTARHCYNEPNANEKRECIHPLEKGAREIPGSQVARRSRSSQTTYGQLLRILIAVMTSASLVFFLVICYSYHSLREETVNRITRRLQTGIGGIEDDLSQVQRRGLELLMMSDTTKIAYLFDNLSPIDQARIVKSIQETLASIQSGSLVVSGEALWIGRNNWLINAPDTGVSFQEDVDLSREIELMGERTVLLLWEDTPRLLLSDTKRSTRTVVVSELDTKRIANALTDSNTSDGSKQG